LQPLPDRVGQVPAAAAEHPGFPLFVNGDVGQRAYRIPYAVVKDDFSAQRRPGDTIRARTRWKPRTCPRWTRTSRARERSTPAPRRRRYAPTGHMRSIFR
jgi:hypothetical protein